MAVTAIKNPVPMWIRCLCGLLVERPIPFDSVKRMQSYSGHCDYCGRVLKGELSSVLPIPYWITPTCRLMDSMRFLLAWILFRASACVWGNWRRGQMQFDRIQADWNEALRK